MKNDSDIWDSRHKARIFRWPDQNSVFIDDQLKVGDRERHIVENQGDDPLELRIDSLYVKGEGDTLIVALHGAQVRNLVDLPRFEWLGALRERTEHLLFIADSMLFKSETLTLGWYIGNERIDLVARLAAYIMNVRNQLGLDRVVFVGSSGGGYASLAISTYIQNSSVVAFSPQTDVWKFSDSHSAAFLAAAFPSSASIEEATSVDPKRFSLIERYKDNTRKNHFLYIQNTGDETHVRDHFKPFAESLGVRLPNGRTFDQSGRFISFKYGEGHAAPPKQRLSEFLDLALAELASPKKMPVISAAKTGNLSDHSFHRGHNNFIPVAPELNSYYMANDPPLQYPAPNLRFDDSGVPLRLINDEEFDHPVLQAQFLLKQLNSLRRTGSTDVELVARAIVRRWNSIAVASRGAKFLPYGFEWNGGKQQPPWYSAMAQGQALSAVARLFEIFPEEEFQELADDLFKSFELLPDAEDQSLPWIVDIDTDGYLWLEEYPYPGQGKCVINGHLFAVWGLYDYWRVFGVKRALELASSALETTKHYILKSRNPGWSSHYDVNNFFLIRNYHQTHISQLEQTYNITANPYFLRVADLLEDDFPSYQRSGSAYLASGDHVLQRMDNTHVPTMAVENRRISLDKAMAVDFEVRTKVEQCDGIWLRLSSGEYSGWWARENPPRVFPRLRFDDHYYRRPRSVALTCNSIAHYSFNKWGSAIDELVVSLGAPTEIQVRCRALWNGLPFYQIDDTSNPLAVPPGRWIRVKDCY